MAANAQVPTGWTSYLRWQGMLDALRGRRTTEGVEAQGAQARPEPRSALPDRRSQAASEAPAVDGWLDGTPD